MMTVAQNVLNLITVVLLAAAGVLLALTRKGLETAVTKGTENAIARANWPQVLARELEKARGTERQEVRFRSYGALWRRMRPTAIYDDSPFNRSTANTLSGSFSEWYFSEEGGLMLTSVARELYFTLQDLLRAIGDGPDWSGERVANPRALFIALLDQKKLANAKDFLVGLEKRRSETWPDDVIGRTSGWRQDIEKIPAFWLELTGAQRFSVIQQVASALRTGLSADVESRLR